MKKLVLALVALVLVVVVAGGLFASAFMGTAPVEDGRKLSDGKVVTVLDGFTSCYLVKTADGGWLLIDVCMDPEAEALTGALADHDADRGDVHAILLTHGHGDHTGGHARFPSAKVHALGSELPLLEGAEPTTSPVGMLTGATDTGVRVEEPLTGGQTVTVGGTDIMVFSVPGHTNGSAAYLVHGALFLGDSARVMSDGALKGAPWIFSNDTAENAHSLTALYNRVQKLDIKHLVPAHTGPSDGIAALKAFTP